MGTSIKKAALIAGILLTLLSLTAIPNAAQVLAPVLEVTPITWNVIGLDLNDVTDGPNHFPVGARVCNTGDSIATNVKSAFIWESVNPYINIRPGTSAAYTSDGINLNPGNCMDFYYEVEVTRINTKTETAFGATRRYVITASADGGITGSTPSPRELFVEKLVDQSRNYVRTITLNGVLVPAGSTMNLIVGQTYTIVMDAHTSTSYDQIESFINFPNTIFQILSVETLYEISDLAENPIDLLYGDACNFDSDPTSDTYLDCLGTGGAGGDLLITYEIKILQVGSTNPQPLSALIYDKSGSSFHYQGDYEDEVRYANIIPADPELSIAKTGLLDLGMDDSANPGDSISYTLTITNTGNIPLTGVSIDDTLLASLTCPSPLPNPFAPGSSFTCTGSYAITQADIDSGTVNNTATADSEESAPVTDEFQQPLPQEPLLSIVKAGTFDAGANGYAQPGELISYGFLVSNEGNVTLTDVTITDLLPGLSAIDCPAPTLAVGADMTCTATYAVTQKDIDAGSVSNIAAADSTESEAATDEATVSLPQDPAISIVKSGSFIAGVDGYAQPGELISYEFQVTNEGNVTLSGITIIDPKVSPISCPNTTLAVGESMTCTGSYAVTQADIDTGSVYNMATADSTESEAAVDTETVALPQDPAISLVKTGTFDPGLDAYAQPGELISYEFLVSNDGNVTLTGITVSDPKVSPISCPTDTLAPGESMTCTGNYAVTQADIESGSVENIATTGSNESEPDDDSETVTLPQNPALTIDKTASPATYTAAGEEITYEFLVTNTGNVTLYNISVVDDLTTNESCPDTSGGLAPGASVTCTASYTVLPADLDAGSVTNSAYATDGTTNSMPDLATVEADLLPAMTLTKTAVPDFSTPTQPGDTISYSLVATNTGNITLTGVSISDPILGTLTCTPAQPTNLAPGDSMTCTGSYILTQEDIDTGAVENTATADSNQTEPVLTPNELPVPQSPHLSLTKTGVLDMTLVDPGIRVDPGDRINYTLTALNDGNQTLTGVTIVDPLLPSLTCTPAQPASLAPGESLVCTGSYTLTQVDINSGTVVNTASSDSDQTIEISSGEEISLPAVPGLTLVKSVQESYFSAEGDLLHYYYLLTNTGNIPLNQIWLTDDKASTVSCPGVSLDPGASMTCTAEYTVTVDDVQTGTVTNLATAASGEGDPVTDSETVNLVAPSIGLAKRLVSIQNASTGTYLVTFEFLIENFGNVDLMGVRVTDDLETAFPAPTTFSVQSLTSTDFTTNTGFNGKDDLDLLDGSDTLAVGESGTIRLVLQVVPAEAGPFYNSASTEAFSPQEIRVTDLSQDGTDPDVTPGGQADANGDGDPTNNSQPTPVSFGEMIFDPPLGIKSVSSGDDVVLDWQVTWINNANIFAVEALASDPIPAGTIFVAAGASSGYPVPGSAPAGSTNIGVACKPDTTSTSTVTSLCYYEGATSSYPLGRVIWQGVLGPDPGDTDAATASNEIVISFQTRVVGNTTEATNTAAIDFDLNGDGDTTDAGELQVRQVSSAWEMEAEPVDIEQLPVTGFAPGRVTLLPAQPQDLAYAATSMLVEIPALGVKIPLVGVPYEEGGWDVTWLGSSAGYLSGTAFPTWSGNSAITAHAYVSSGLPGPFANLNKMKWGDQIIIHAFGQKHIYQVQSSKYVRPDDTGVLSHKDIPWLTLLTCREYNEKTGTYKWRLAVQAVLVEVVAGK